MPMQSICDLVVDCIATEDERLSCQHRQSSLLGTPPPAVIDFDGRGRQWKSFSVRAMAAGSAARCPDTHFRCAEEGGYCLPVYLRCNGVKDCQGGEDEAECQAYSCSGWYRCRGSLTVCLHPRHVCDGVYQCPKRDDELGCGSVTAGGACPESCVCYGLAFFCGLQVGVCVV